MKKFLILIFCFFTFSNNFVLADRIKDMASIAGVRTNQLVGYGLVVGLAKSGDGSVELNKALHL